MSSGDRDASSPDTKEAKRRLAELEQVLMAKEQDLVAAAHIGQHLLEVNNNLRKAYDDLLNQHQQQQQQQQQHHQTHHQPTHRCSSSSTYTNTLVNTTTSSTVDDAGHCRSDSPYFDHPSRLSPEGSQPPSVMASMSINPQRTRRKAVRYNAKGSPVTRAESFPVVFQSSDAEGEDSQASRREGTTSHTILTQQHHRISPLHRRHGSTSPPSPSISLQSIDPSPTSKRRPRARHHRSKTWSDASDNSDPEASSSRNDITRSSQRFDPTSYIQSLERNIEDLTSQVKDLQSRLHSDRSLRVRSRQEIESLKSELSTANARSEALEEELARVIRRRNRLGDSNVFRDSSTNEVTTSPTSSERKAWEDTISSLHHRIDSLESDLLRTASAKQESDRKLENLLALLRASEDRCFLLESEARERELRLLNVDRMERYIQELNGMLEEERAARVSLEGLIGEGSPTARVGSPKRNGDRLSSFFGEKGRVISNAFKDMASKPASLDLDSDVERLESRVFLNTSPPRRKVDANASSIPHRRPSALSVSTPSLSASSVRMGTPTPTPVVAFKGLAEALTLTKGKARSDSSFLDKVTSPLKPTSPERKANRKTTPLPTQGFGLSQALALTPTPKRILGNMSNPLSGRIYDRVIGVLAVHDEPITSSDPLSGPSDLDASSSTDLDFSGPTLRISVASSPSSSPRSSSSQPKISSPLGESPLSIRIPTLPVGPLSSGKTSPVSITPSNADSWKSAMTSTLQPKKEDNTSDDEDDDEFFSTRGSLLMSPASYASRDLGDASFDDGEAGKVLSSLLKLDGSSFLPKSLADELDAAGLVYAENPHPSKNLESTPSFVDRWLGMFSRLVKQPSSNSDQNSPF
ncbi:hypothetical protein HDU97_001280 [Phlyctochytrium planicorne]|nr:hypothetical protein HDU97_001280 [Phlyctochytrium planicorne]